jgi:Fur family ferric uptake transcriptional regulator
MGVSATETLTPGQIYDVVRSNGGRLTVPLRVLVDVLLEHEDHLTADELIAAVDRRVPGIAPSTVYRLLQRLEDAGVLEHIHIGRGPTIYHLRHHEHGHLVCHQCGTIIDIPEAAFDGLAKTVGQQYDFTIDPRHAALLGRCRNCAA